MEISLSLMVLVNLVTVLSYVFGAILCRHSAFSVLKGLLSTKTALRWAWSWVWRAPWLRVHL